MSEQTSVLDSLITRWRAGDKSALDELCEHTLDTLTRRAHLMLARRADVKRWNDTDDILQGAMLRLLKHFKKSEKKVNDIGHYYALSSGAIRHELIDLARKYSGPEGLGANHASNAARNESNEEIRPRYEASDETYDPTKLAAWTEFHEYVEALPSDEQRIWDLLFYQQLNQEQAATILGMDRKTLGKKWREAKLRWKSSAGDSDVGANVI